jgi:metallo-beta-lactamase family protein
MEMGSIPEVPLFLNSPMAIDVTALYDRHRDAHILSVGECRAAFGRARLVRSVDESKALNRRRGPLIVVAGAGMLTGGRILHHIRAFGGDRRNTILLVGHQAEGTRGAALLAGARALKIHGSYVPIEAEVARIDGFSAHAGQPELLAWLGASVPAPNRVYLVHGEPVAADCLRLKIRDTLGVHAYVARDGEHIAAKRAP